MLGRLGSLDLLRRFDDDDEERAEEGFTVLRLFLAELLLTAGVQATVEFLRDRSTRAHGGLTPRSFQGDGSPVTTALEAAPALLGPLAAAAHASHAFRPSERAHLLTRILNGAVIGAGAAGLAETILAASRRERRFSFSPLLFGYIGVLGVLLDREEASVEEESERLRRRASLVDRWTPKRRTKVDKIVVHV